jgi:hypothetical protein
MSPEMEAIIAARRRKDLTKKKRNKWVARNIKNIR